MFKVTFKVPDGREFTEEYSEPQAFIAEQLADFDTIPDELVVTQVELDGQILDFTGNIGDLYNKFS